MPRMFSTGLTSEIDKIGFIGIGHGFLDVVVGMAVAFNVELYGGFFRFVDGSGDLRSEFFAAELQIIFGMLPNFKIKVPVLEQTERSPPNHSPFWLHLPNIR